MNTYQGITLGPSSPLLAGPVDRTEDDEQRLCDDLICRISGKDDGVVEQSQKRAATFLTRGIPDRRYRLLGLCVSWETKPCKGKLTQSQHDYLLRELQFGAYACCGGLEDLEGFVRAVRFEHQTKEPRIREYCYATIARWAAKGYRSERRSRRRRSR
jgi:hypothetical protein